MERWEFFRKGPAYPLPYSMPLNINFLQCLRNWWIYIIHLLVANIASNRNKGVLRCVFWSSVKDLTLFVFVWKTAAADRCAPLNTEVTVVPETDPEETTDSDVSEPAVDIAEEETVPYGNCQEEISRASEGSGEQRLAEKKAESEESDSDHEALQVVRDIFFSWCSNRCWRGLFSLHLNWRTGELGTTLRRIGFLDYLCAKPSVLVSCVAMKFSVGPNQLMLEHEFQWDVNRRHIGTNNRWQIKHRVLIKCWASTKQ